ncbi:hypothetical protein GN156_00300 [bacterium LRH843]|nr:hypothetical protein [bacterium LRH843]
MSDEFKKRLEAYENDLLKGKELEEFEEELAKLEQYQEYLEINDESRNAPQINEEKQKKILRSSKWKARFQTAFFAFSMLIIVTVVSIVLTAIYYSWGEPDRIDVFRTVIDHTLTVTEPYGDIGGTNSNSKSFFRMEMTRNLNKRVGREQIKVGEMKVNFLFSLMGFPERNDLGKISQDQPAFTYPGSGDRGMSDWDTLANLPEGTVVSAYLSFNELMDTNEVFSHFSGKDLDIVWLAVDTGVEGIDGRDHGVIFDPVGFPSYPIWHEEDMKLDFREEQKGFLFGKIVSEGHSSPEYNEGDSNVLHTQFLKTLMFLEKHEKKANKLYSGHRLNLGERIDFLETNGIKHYGVVVTGPTKEVLELRDEKLISSVEVDEVEFWNW